MSTSYVAGTTGGEEDLTWLADGTLIVVTTPTPSADSGLMPTEIGLSRGGAPLVLSTPQSLPGCDYTGYHAVAPASATTFYANVVCLDDNGPTSDVDIVNEDGHILRKAFTSTSYWSQLSVNASGDLLGEEPAAWCSGVALIDGGHVDTPNVVVPAGPGGPAFDIGSYITMDTAAQRTCAGIEAEHPAWAADGRHFFFLARQGQEDLTLYQAEPGGDPVPLVDHIQEPRGLAASPTGGTLLLTGTLRGHAPGAWLVQLAGGHVTLQQIATGIFWAQAWDAAGDRVAAVDATQGVVGHTRVVIWTIPTG